jgi:hypothetical protein
MFISRLKRIDIASISERGRLTVDVEIFGILANLTLQSHSTMQHVNLLYIIKYLQVVEYFLGFALLF